MINPSPGREVKAGENGSRIKMPRDASGIAVWHNRDEIVKSMGLELKRVILFTRNLEAMGRFYGEVLSLELTGTEPGWREYRAGGCAIALHEGDSRIGNRPPKFVFYGADVAAIRATLIRRGARMGKILCARNLDLCDGKDPDGNAFQISSRK